MENYRFQNRPGLTSSSAYQSIEFTRKPVKELRNSTALFPHPQSPDDDPWLRVPAALPPRLRRFGWLPLADLALLWMLLALSLGHG
jgi:hypothetical protein